MGKSDLVNPGMRLAFHRDGNMWVAQLETDGKAPIVMGSVIINALADQPELRKAFVDMMKLVVEVALRESAGLTGAVWDDNVVKAGMN